MQRRRSHAQAASTVAWMVACVALHGTTATVGGALPRPIGEGGFETVTYASATASLAAVARRGGRR